MKQYLALKASAGSGKTFALSVRYLSLLLQDINPNTILTLTFTNKASLEMSERIFKTLLSLGDDEVILEEIIKQSSLTKEQILEKKQKIIQRFLKSELSILTLDKFMNKVLREFSGYLGLGEDFAIANNDHQFLLYKFLTSLDEKYFDTLVHFSTNEESSLKTIISLFAILDEKNETLKFYEFEQSILDGFETTILNEASKIREAVINLELSKSAINAVTFKNIKELMSIGKTWLSKDSLVEYSYFKKAGKKIAIFDNSLHIIQEHIKYYINYEEQGKLNQLFTIYNYYRDFRLQYKKQKNQLKFSDVTNFVYELLENYIDKNFLYFRLDSKYEHIMIDEFQDTSVLQFKILKPLIDEIFSGNSERYKTFFYVGDTKQSIYRFRGGRKELFEYVSTIYQENLEVESLNTNYRSGKTVVGFVNDIFTLQNNYEYDEQLVKSPIDGVVEVVKLEVDDEPYKDIKIKIDELISLGEDINNIAILTFTNNDVFGVYEYLKKHYTNMNIVTDMTSKLINQNNVKAIINGLKYLYFNEPYYLATFNSILGFELLEQFKCEVFLQNTRLEKVVYEIANYYKLMDENVVKFLEIIDTYKDITDFVYEIDYDDSSMVTKDNIGLQILTIFKSKGLEYKTVLLLDRVKKSPPDKSKLLFYYDNVELKRIFFKDTNRVNFDSFYSDAVKTEQIQKKDDILNILYVAMTRAKYNMCIFKKDKDSVFDVLDYPISSYKKGNFYIDITNIYEEKIDTVQYFPLSFGEQIIENKTILEEDSNLKARYFGIATHFCLEMMKSFDKKSLDFVFSLTKSKYNAWLDNNEFTDLYNRILMMIEDNMFQSIINKAEIYKEQELTYNGELKIIDLLVEHEDKFIVIDYKTTHQKSDTHFNQVNFYKKAISEITKKEVDGYLLYLQKDKIEIVKTKW
jgi:exodeoxyribonuclease V beta subunit